MRYLLMIIGLLEVCTARAQEPLYDKIFFANSRMDKSYFYSETSYKNTSWIKNVQKKLPVNDSLFFTPGNSLELNYVSGKEGEWQAKIIFHPMRGMDFFTPATSLVMRLMVRSSTQLTELPEIGLGNKKDSVFSYTSLQKFVTDYQPNKWLTVKIPLSEFKTDIAKSDVIIFRQQSSDGKEHSLLIDQVELLPDN